MKSIATGITLISFIICGSPIYADQNADNSIRNQSDRLGLNPTAQDQSNRKTAIKTVAKLRHKIMASNLSTNAQNIKIVDENGCIFLRGPVDSEQERAIIDGLASECCGTNFVDRLEVKTK
jgi:hyperosmotically inducible periplasmic protein